MADTDATRLKPTLAEQLLERQKALMNAPAATPPPAPAPLSVGDRLNLAFAGLDPQFRRDVVQPQIDERRNFVANQQAFQQKQIEQEQEAIKSAIPLANFEQQQIEKQDALKKQAEAMKEGFSSLAEEYTRLVGDESTPGPVMSLISSLEATGNPSDRAAAERLHAQAALIELQVIKADQGMPQTPEGFQRAIERVKELKSLLNTGTADLTAQEAAKASETEQNKRQKQSQEFQRGENLLSRQFQQEQQARQIAATKENAAGRRTFIAPTVVKEYGQAEGAIRLIQEALKIVKTSSPSGPVAQYYKYITDPNAIRDLDAKLSALNGLLTGESGGKNLSQIEFSIFGGRFPLVSNRPGTVERKLLQAYAWFNNKQLILDSAYGSPPIFESMRVPRVFVIGGNLVQPIFQTTPEGEPILGKVNLEVGP